MTAIDRLARITHLPPATVRRVVKPLAWPVRITASPVPSPALWARRLRHPFLDWDEAVTRANFRAAFGREIDLETPRTFNEKINWLKLYDRRPVHSVMSSKVAARDFVAGRGFGGILQELYGVWDRAEDVPLGDLPESFALKASHGCDMNWFRLPGDPLRPRAIRRVLRGWLRTDHSLRAGEWNYRDMPRRILAEALMPVGDGLPHEYKFWCFGGVPRLVRYIEGRFDARGRTGRYLDVDWKPLPFTFRGASELDDLPPRPPQLARMVEIAAALSAGEPYLRVDLYVSGGEIRLGELTLRPNGGTWNFRPPEVDERVGEWLELPGAGANSRERAVPLASPGEA